MSTPTSRPEPQPLSIALRERSKPFSLPLGAVTARRRNLAVFAIACVALFYGITSWYYNGLFADTRSFWLPWSEPIYNPATPLWTPHFVYSPVAALALRPFGLLPFPVFAVLWTALGVATYAWLLYPLPVLPRLVAFIAGCLFAANGNTEWAISLMVVVGMTRPSAWLFAAFTKVSPFLGFGWFILRRDWKAVATTGALGILLVIASAIALPGEWPVWLRMLSTFGGQTDVAGKLMPALPLLPRLPIAVGLLAWGAAKRRPDVLPLVIMLSQPDLQPWLIGYLAALPRLELVSPKLKGGAAITSITQGLERKHA